MTDSPAPNRDSAVLVLKQEEEEGRAAYTEQVKVLYGRLRDIGLAAHDGAAAAGSILAMAETLHGASTADRRALLIAEGDSLVEYGDQKGSNVHLVAAIAVRRATLRLAATPDEIGDDQNLLGNALSDLGEREGGTARLEEAVVAYRAALEEFTRDRMPLYWAMTQNNLGNALWTLGARESGTARLDEAVAAYRAALEEWTRDRVPLDWAMTQNNLGTALQTLGARESGTARLEEAVAAYRAALEEWTRDREPLDWAAAQMGLGNALWKLAERGSDTTHANEASAAFRAAIEVRTLAANPQAWAAARNNLGAALYDLCDMVSRQGESAPTDEWEIAAPGRLVLKGTGLEVRWDGAWFQVFWRDGTLKNVAPGLDDAKLYAINLARQLREMGLIP